MTDLFELLARNGKRLLIAIVIILLSGTVITWYSYRSAIAFIDATQKVSHTEQVLKTINATEITLLNAETGERGYLIVGRPEYLQPYYLALAGIDANIRALATLTADSPVQQKHIQELRGHVKLRLDRLRLVIQGYQHGGISEVRDMVGNETGKVAMDAARAVLAAMTDEETALLERRNAVAIQQARNAISTIFGALLVSFCLIPATFLLLTLGRVNVE